MRIAPPIDLSHKINLFFRAFSIARRYLDGLRSFLVGLPLHLLKHSTHQRISASLRVPAPLASLASNTNLPPGYLARVRYAFRFSQPLSVFLRQIRIGLFSCLIRFGGFALQSFLLPKIRFAFQHPVAVLTFALMSWSLDNRLKICHFSPALQPAKMPDGSFHGLAPFGKACVLPR